MIGRRVFGAIGLIALLLFFSFHQKGFAKGHYTVKSGDTLDSISKSFGVSIEALKITNHLNGNLIRPKQVLWIPAPGERGKGKGNTKGSIETDTYVVKKGDSLYSISKRAGITIEEIKRMNDLHSKSLKIGQILVFPKQEGIQEESIEVAGDAEQGMAERSTEGNGQEISEPLGKWNNPGERTLFIKVVKNFLGAPYRLGGSTLKGIDCSAFVKKVYEIFDVSLPRTAREQICVGKKIEKHQLEEGDLVFFKRRGNNAHVGIYIGNNEFVHASSSSKQIKIDSLETPYYSERFLKGVRVKELDSFPPIS